MGLKSNDKCHIYKRHTGQETDTWRRSREDEGRDWSEMATSHGTRRFAGPSGSQERGTGQTLREASGGSPALLPSGSGLQNCERISFCGSRPPRLQYFVTTVSGKEYRNELWQSNRWKIPDHLERLLDGTGRTQGFTPSSPKVGEKGNKILMMGPRQHGGLRVGRGPAWSPLSQRSPHVPALAEWRLSP